MRFYGRLVMYCAIGGACGIFIGAACAGLRGVK